MPCPEIAESPCNITPIILIFERYLYKNLKNLIIIFIKLNQKMYYLMF